MKKFLIIIIVSFLIIFITFFFFYKQKEVTIIDDLQIHFLSVGNGDSIYIKSGENDILVDAGSSSTDANVIRDYVDDYVTDNKFELIIATHADNDHISGFVGSTSAPGIFETYEIDMIIDFPLSDKTTSVYTNYLSMRDDLVENGTIHYNALQCYNNTDNASRTYDIGNEVCIEFLYNYYYEVSSNDENEYSVCFLLTHFNNSFLFTGDLESDGEKYLVQYNDLSEVTLFKAGHHGSATSSTSVLLDIIQPQYCVVTCEAGGKYDFPTQEFINRISVYTQLIYVTNDFDETDLNGHVCVTSDGYDININCSNNNTILKESDWFIQNRYWPI